jgi:fructose-1-phosphate kinase PfkB-like protein
MTLLIWLMDEKNFPAGKGLEVSWVLKEWVARVLPWLCGDIMESRLVGRLITMVLSRRFYKIQ